MPIDIDWHFVTFIDERQHDVKSNSDVIIEVNRHNLVMSISLEQLEQNHTQFGKYFQFLWVLFKITQKRW